MRFSRNAVNATWFIAAGVSTLWRPTLLLVEGFGRKDPNGAIEKERPLNIADDAEAGQGEESLQGPAQSHKSSRTEESFEDVDVGVLQSSEVPMEHRQRSLTATCSKGYLTCVNGFLPGYEGIPSKSCFNHCVENDGNCCFYNNGMSLHDACVRFSGDICLGGTGSCTGFRACEDATLGKVIDGCKGREACWQSGTKNTVISNSCVDDYSCLGSFTEFFSGNVENSCHGVGSCKFTFNANGANTADILDSCNDVDACFSAVGYYGSSNLFSQSCNGVAACYYMAYWGAVDSVIQSCNGQNSCRKMANTTAGNVGVLRDCCNVDNECSNNFQSDTDLPSECMQFNPSESPSQTPSLSTSPSSFPTASPSFVPSLSRSPSGAPSILPSMLDQQIDTNVDEISSGVVEIQGILGADVGGGSCDGIDAEVIVTGTSGWWTTTTTIAVLITDSGVPINADADPQVFVLNTFAGGKTSASNQVINNFEMGNYIISFGAGASNVFYVNYVVNGVEKTVMARSQVA